MSSPSTRKSSRLAQRAQAAAATASSTSTDDDAGTSTSENSNSNSEVGRPKRKRARISYNYDGDESDEEESEEVEIGVEKAPRFRGNRGKLERLAEIPLDILFEVRIVALYLFSSVHKGVLQIFGYLAPYDLLRLARTTKDLRKLLMDKSSSSVWQAARSNVPGLPVPLLGMSEPEYAHLMFSSQCHVRIRRAYFSAPWSDANHTTRLVTHHDARISFGCLRLVSAHMTVSVSWLLTRISFIGSILQ